LKLGVSPALAGEVRHLALKMPEVGFGLCGEQLALAGKGQIL